MKTIAEKKAETQKSKRTDRFSTSSNYYFHPDEDFKEDYEWGKDRAISKTNSQNTGKIVLR
jgi:hypothetical protein